jgi:hypothetical protein
MKIALLEIFGGLALGYALIHYAGMSTKEAVTLSCVIAAFYYWLIILGRFK